MREEVKRILKMVQEGKISAEDAADLIEAFDEVDAQEPEAVGVGAGASSGTSGAGAGGGRGESTAGKDPFSAFMDTMEKFGRDAAKSVDWRDISRQVRESAQQGIDALKHGLEQVNSGRGFVWGGATEVREISLPLSVPDGKLLRVENQAGDIRISSGAELGNVTARAEFRGINSDETKQRAATYTLLVEESDSVVLVRQPDIPNVTVDLVITLPNPVGVEVRSASGDISIIDTKGACRISARSADVRLRNLDGAVEINLMSGDITLEDITSPQVTLENKSGDLKLRRVKGNVSARTTSGDVEVSDFDGKTASVETVSGDIRAGFLTPITGSVNFRTVSGDVDLRVPDGSDCRVSLSSLSGDIEAGLTMVDLNETDRRVTGRLGEGAGTLDISAVNGDIRLTMAKTEVHE
ncbi:MAG TPA: DUF4097 family beta strand repeat-containing protein [Fimbriimonadaceae bacterium]|nr:DUF4097 family beta strand repeat-containing protein [Fimbriimonadaceae bacterium]